MLYLHSDKIADSTDGECSDVETRGSVMATAFATEKWVEVLKQFDAQTKRKLTQDSKWMDDVLQMLKKNQFEAVDDLDGVTYDMLAFTTNDADEEVPALQQAAFRRILAEYNRIRGSSGNAASASADMTQNTKAVSNVGVTGQTV